jgi:CubicO group peptidase (beta-lactamase class C family)
MRKILGAALVFAPLVLSMPALAAEPASVVAAIDKAAAAAVAAGESPAIQLAVFQNGKPLLVKAYGSANLELKVPANNDSVFRIGSVTKQFTAVTLLLLQEEGKLSLDDKLAKYYPDFPRASDITLAQMLHHTSGIYNYTEHKDFFAKDGFVARTTDEMVQYIAGLPKTQDFEPGTSWYYSNSAYFILGGVIEKATGQKIADVLQARLFKPLGMTHTALDDEAEIAAGRVAGYGSTGPGKFTNATFLSMTLPGAAGSMRSSAADLVKWNAALYGGKLLKPASLQAMLTPGKLKDGTSTRPAMVELFKKAGQEDKGEGTEYGYGVMLANKQGHKKVHHGGGINGFNAYLAEFPDDHMTIALLTNTIGKDVGATNVAERIERIALGLPAKK